MVSTLLIVLSKKKSKIGNIMVSITTENILAFMIGSGMNLGVFEK
jgi:hypothetical protein